MDRDKLKINSKTVLVLVIVLIFVVALFARCAGSSGANGNVKEGNNPASEQGSSGNNDSNTNGETIDNDTDNTDGNNQAAAPDAGVYAPFDGALFIGDSRTEGVKIYAGITNADFFCGKSMSVDKIMNGTKVNVGGVNVSIQELLDSKQYKKIYIGLGVNELGWKSVDVFTEKYKTLIDDIKSRQPSAKIYIQAIFPVSQKKHEEGTIVNNTQIYMYNTELVKLAIKTKSRYVNADAPLVDENGALKMDATNDGVHIKSEYCRSMAEYLASITV